MHPNRKAVVLLSGGLDSTTILALARSNGFEVYALTFRYGQRHDTEIEAAQKVTAALGVQKHVIIPIDLHLFGGSVLTGDGDIPRGRSREEIGHGIPITYVPARNTIFLSYALAWAEVLEASDIFLGANALDASGYPDCRPEYIEAYQRMANLATRVGVEGRRLTIHTPLIHLTKVEIICKGVELGVDYGLTWTCYEPSPAGEACGQCDACVLRRRGFAELGLNDPVRYRPEAFVPV